VDFLHTYAALKPANVDSVLTLLDWTANGRPKAMHYISTFGVIDLKSGPGEISEQTEISSWRGLVGGYAQSKWVGDTFARQAQVRGLPVSIYRLGAITGDRLHAIFNETDLIWRIVRLCAQVGAVPDAQKPIIMTPADDVARAVVSLSRDSESHGQIHHLMSSQDICLTDMVPAFRRIGQQLDVVPFDHWVERVRDYLLANRDDEMSTVVSILSQYDVGVVLPRVTSERTRAKLKLLDAEMHPIASELFERYLINLGLQQAPLSRTLAAEQAAE